MRIGEIDDALGKEFAARRDSMSSELSRLGARLAEGGKEATAPAVRLADTVRISPEARAAQFSHRAAELPLAPFPSPVELVAALKDLASASTPAAAAKLAEQITILIQRIAQSFPGAAAVPVAGAADEVAAALVRAALATPPNASPTPGTPPPSPGQIANLVRQLFAAIPLTSAASTPGVLTPSTAERAAVAILLAIVRNGGGEQLVPQPPASQQPTSFPAALLGLLAGATPPRARNRERKRPAKFPSSPQDEEGRETPEESSRDRK